MVGGDEDVSFTFCLLKMQVRIELQYFMLRRKAKGGVVLLLRVMCTHGHAYAAPCVRRSARSYSVLVVPCILSISTVPDVF